MNININNLTVNFKGDNVVKLSSWCCGWIESTFYVYFPFILHQFVTRDRTCPSKFKTLLFRVIFVSYRWNKTSLSKLKILLFKVIFVSYRRNRTCASKFKTLLFKVVFVSYRWNRTCASKFCMIGQVTDEI